jgi:hypothetical protein
VANKAIGGFVRVERGYVVVGPSQHIEISTLVFKKYPFSVCEFKS